MRCSDSILESEHWIIAERGFLIYTISTDMDKTSGNSIESRCQGLSFGNSFLAGI
jgi:hypothetical protein